MKRKLIESMLKIFVSVALFCVFSIAAAAEPFETIISNGNPQNRVDIAILGDGYTAAQLAQYRTDVQQFMQNVFAQEPYREYQKFYNVHRIDVTSNQSGADHPERTPQVFVDTALDATYNCANIQRLICVNNTKVNQAISRTLSAGYFDVVLVMVNDTEYGGSGGSIAVASINSAAVELILHEVGHSFGLLADEYTGGGPSCNPNIEPSEVNATRETTRALIKWNHWIDGSTPIPTTTTTAAIPGLYVGSRYCDVGLYRPTFNNKMRSLGFPFEQINNEQHVKRIYNFVSPIDAVSPAGTTVTLNTNQSQTFTVTTPMPFTHNLTINWLVDGQSRGSGSSFALNGGTLTPGNHTVQAVVADTTPFVRNDPQQLLSETRMWNVSVQSAPARKQFDFDGDSRADVSVFRPSNGTWYLLNSQNGFSAVQFGVSGDKLAPADFDGDGKTDLAVFRDGNWFIQRSTAGFTAVQFGQTGDAPQPADFDGDGKAELTVFRASNGVWYSLNLQNNQFSAAQFGISTDKPVVGDFDGDGRADQAVFRDGVWYVLRSQLGFTAVQFGSAGDKTVQADYDGDGKTDQAVFRNGIWYMLGSQNGFSAIQFGITTDLPAPADYDGDGKTDQAVFRDGNWYLNRSTQGFSAIQFGIVNDKPIPNSFIQ